MAKIAEQLPAMGTALAGLILVFLGISITSWERYEVTEQKPVRAKYQRRVWLGFLGMLFSLVAAILGLVALGMSNQASELVIDWALLCLAVSVVCVLIIAIMLLSEI